MCSAHKLQDAGAAGFAGYQVRGSCVCQTCPEIQVLHSNPHSNASKEHADHRHHNFQQIFQKNGARYTHGCLRRTRWPLTAVNFGFAKAWSDTVRQVHLQANRCLVCHVVHCCFLEFLSARSAFASYRCLLCFFRAFLRQHSGVCGQPTGVRGAHEGMAWRSPSGTSCHDGVPHAGGPSPNSAAGGSSRSVAAWARWAATASSPDQRATET